LTGHDGRVTWGRTRRSIAALLTADALSALASMAQATILGKLVYDITGSELDLGLLGLAEFAPAFVLVLVSGTVADRVDRRRIVAVSALVQAVMALGLGWYAGTHPTSIVPIFGLVIGFGIALAFSAPAARSLPADLVASERLPWLIARSAVAFEVGIIVGPVVGAFLYAVDVRLPFLAIAAALVAMAVAISLVHIEPRVDPQAEAAEAAETAAAVERERLLAEARAEAVEEASTSYSAAAPGRATLHEAFEGLRFVRSQPALLGAISLDLFAVLFGGAVALLPAIAKDRLGVGVIGLGWLRAAAGIGAATTTLALAVRPLTRHVGAILLSVVAIFGVATIALGITTSYAVAIVAILILSGADAISVFIRATLVPLMTPTDKRGRVLAVENVFIGASNELGAFESGVLGQLLGTAGSVVLGGFATLGVALSWCLLFPTLRRVDRFPDHADE
jgi:MFS family permease